MSIHRSRVVSEPLEPRTLLATSIVLQSGQLIITGTNLPDILRVSISGPNVVAAANGMTRTFAAKTVKSILINGKSGNDSIRNDTKLPSTLNGGAGNDVLKGGTNNDVFNGGSGSDLLRPGDGSNSGVIDFASDTLDYRDATPGEFLFLAPRVNEIEMDHGRAKDTFSCSFSSGHLVFFATPGDDFILGDCPFDGEFHGGNGNDSIEVANNIIDGVGEEFSNVSAYGDAGNDYIQANGEDYFLALGDGGAGNDVYDYFNSNGGDGPFVDTGGGHDTASVLNSEDTPDIFVKVSPGIEDCFVGGVTVSLTGNDLDNHLTVAANKATILGGKGNDTIEGTAGDDLLDGGDGNDSIQADEGNDILRGGAGNDTLIGNAGSDALLGQSGNDTLFAKDGEHDFVDGGSGSDRAQRDQSGAMADSVVNIESFI